MNSVLTKDDLKNVATKEDLKKFATKTELRNVEKNLRGEILRVEEKVENLEDGQKRIENKIDGVEERLSAKIDKVMNTLDGFVGIVDTLRTENEIGTHQMRELDIRVTKLESSKQPA